MTKKSGLYKKGIESISAPGIIVNNALIIVWILLGAIACKYISIYAAYIYAAYSVTIVFLVLRKLVCTNCYYYDKWCYLGWGKLSAKLFKKGKMEAFDSSVGIKIAPLVYGSLTLIPILALSISAYNKTIQTSTFLYIFTGIAVLSIYEALSRKKICSQCKMKFVCPGSAAKTHN